MSGAFDALLDRLRSVVDEREAWKARAEKAEAERDALRADGEKYRQKFYKLCGLLYILFSSTNPLEALEVAVRKAKEVKDDA